MREEHSHTRQVESYPPFTNDNHTYTRLYIDLPTERITQFDVELGALFEVNIAYKVKTRER